LVTIAPEKGFLHQAIVNIRAAPSHGHTASTK
jgi:hypothetical protein